VCLQNRDPSKRSRVKENFRDLHLIVVYLWHAAKTRRIIDSAFVPFTYTAPSRIPLGFLLLLAAKYTSRTKNSNSVLQIRLSCRREGGRERGREGITEGERHRGQKRRSKEETGGHIYKGERFGT